MKTSAQKSGRKAAPYKNNTSGALAANSKISKLIQCLLEPLMAAQAMDEDEAKGIFYTLVSFYADANEHDVGFTEKLVWRCLGELQHERGSD